MVDLHQPSGEAAVTSLVLIIGGLLALVGVVVAILTAANRKGAAEARMAKRAQTAEANVRALKKRNAIDEAIAATDDANLAELARSVLHNKP